MTPEQPSPPRSASTSRALHLITLWAFAVAQPIYDILAQYPTFFVAHNGDAQDLRVFALLISVLLPASLALLAWGAGRVRNTIALPLHHVLVFTLAILAVLPILKKSVHASDVVVLMAAMLGGSIFVFAYSQFLQVRTLITLCSVAILIFPAHFLLFSPLRKLGRSPIEPTPQAGTVGRRMPIVMLVFDAIATPYLLDEDHHIDEHCYPHFAALAANSHWFRNAMTVADSTERAVPAILTGLYDRRQEEAPTLPARVDYPRNLFTLLDGAYGLNVVETLTRLSPTAGLEHGSDRHHRVWALVRDASFVYAHIVSPEDLSRHLPNIAQNWGQFLGEGQTNEWANRRPRQFKSFADSIQATKEPSLNFLHIVFPHVPFEYLPSGIRYLGRQAPDGLDHGAWDMWTTDEREVAVGLQRYLLQLAYADTLLGEMLARLKAVGLYDEALVIVTADHGVSFRPGDHRRGLTATNVASIAPVPLLMKVPHQTEGIVSDRRVEVVDILPTIADVIEMPLPWKVDGVSVFDAGGPERLRTVVSGAGDNDVVVDYAALDEARRESVRRKVSLFGSGPGCSARLFRMGPHKELIGRTIGKDVVSTSLFRAEIEQRAFLDDVDTQGGILPAYLRGWLVTSEPAAPPRDLAIAVNGKIHATASVSEAGVFVCMLPEEAFRAGRNEIDVLVVVSGPDGGTDLLRTKGSQEAGYRLEGRRVVDLHTAKSTSLDSRAMGFVDSVSVGGSVTEIVGWSADVERGELVDEVIVFVDGEVAYATKTGKVRSDVSEAHNNEKLRPAGFRIWLPRETLESARELRVVAVSAGEYFELNYSAAARHSLPQFRDRAGASHGPEEGEGG